MIDYLKNARDFTASEQKLAAYILTNIGSVIGMTIREVAQSSYTSASAVTRLCKKAGAASFSDFKIRLTADRENELRAQAPDVDIPFSADDSYESIARKIAQISVKSILQTNASLDFSQLKNVVNCLLRSGIIDIYGEGDSLQEAFDFVNKMMRIGKIVRIERDTSVQAHQAVTSDSSHCAILISHSGEKQTAFRIASILKKHSVPIILITSNPDSSLKRMVTWCIWTGIYETRSLTQKLTTYSSQVVVHYILDCIFSFVYASDYEKNRAFTIGSEREIEGIFHTFISDTAKPAETAALAPGESVK